MAEKVLTLEEIRSEIDKIDRQIIGLLSQRLALAMKTADYKKSKASLIDHDRYIELITIRRKWALEVKLDPSKIEEIYAIIHEYCYFEQEKLAQTEFKNRKT